MNPFDNIGNQLTAPELLSQLQHIRDASTTLSPAPSVSYFTALPRVEWAKIRKKLIDVHPENLRILQLIEQSMMIVGIDNSLPVDNRNILLNTMMGDMGVKWLDKSSTVLLFDNGLFSSNHDHAAMDGSVGLNAAFYVDRKVRENNDRWQGSHIINEMQKPEFLKFYLDASLKGSLNDAKAYYKKINAKCIALLQAATKKHMRLMEEACNLSGCDRHLFGLANVAKEEGFQEPEILRHPADSKSGGGGNFILSTSCVGYLPMIGTTPPMCKNGYGIFYTISSDRISLTVTAWSEDQETNVDKLKVEIAHSLLDIGQLLECARTK